MRFSDGFHFQWLAATENDGTSMYRTQLAEKQSFSTSCVVLMLQFILISLSEDYQIHQFPRLDLCVNHMYTHLASVYGKENKATAPADHEQSGSAAQQASFRYHLFSQHKRG
jgi:hypothetical protein